MSERRIEVGLGARSYTVLVGAGLIGRADQHGVAARAQAHLDSPLAHGALCSRRSSPATIAATAALEGRSSVSTIRSASA